jgi:hypothetical protein
MTAVALAAAATHSTLTPYLAIPLVAIGLTLNYIRRRRR